MPYEVVFGRKPDLSKVREWGSVVYARTERRNKLEWRVDKVRWMGVDDKSENAYHIYWPSKRIVTIERNVYWKLLRLGLVASRSSYTGSVFKVISGRIRYQECRSSNLRYVGSVLE